MITLVVDFHSSTTYLQSQKFLALVTTLKYFFQSIRKILSGPCIQVNFKCWDQDGIDYSSDQKLPMIFQAFTTYFIVSSFLFHPSSN